MDKNKMNMLDDVLTIVSIIKTGIENDKLNSHIKLYDCYRLLSTMLESSYSFVEILKMGIEDSEIKSIMGLAPATRWLNSVERNLKIFNDDLLRFLRIMVHIDFNTNNTKDILRYNLARFSTFVPYNKYDNKIKLQLKNTIVYFDYEFVHLKINLSDVGEIGDRHFGRDTVYTTLSIQFGQNLINGFLSNIKKLEDFKSYLEVYMKTNIKIEDVFDIKECAK